MRILIDCDEVLCRFREKVNHEIEDAFGIPEGRLDALQPKDSWDVFDHLNNELKMYAFSEILREDFCYSLRPFAWQKPAVEHLLCKHDLYVVTAPWKGSRYWHQERLRWLRDHFDIPEERVIFTSAKHLVRGDVFVDDHPGHVDAWITENPEGNAFLHANKTNGNWQGKYATVMSLDQVIRECLL